MEQNTEIIDLSSLQKQQIIKEVLGILRESQRITKFTILLSRSLSSNDKDSETLFSNQTRNKKTQDFFIKPEQSKLQGLSQYEIEQIMQGNNSFNLNPYELSKKFYHRGSFEDSLEILLSVKEEMQAENQQQKYSKQFRQVMTYIANCNFQLNNYQKAIGFYKILLDEKHMQSQEQKVSKEIGQIYNNLGCCYGKLGHEKPSMTSYSNALKIYGQYQDIDSSPLLTNIANIYFNTKMYETAEKYYKEAVIESKSKKHNNKKGLIFHSQYRLAQCQINLKKYKQAEQNMDKTLKYANYGFGNMHEVLLQSAYLYELQMKWTQAIEVYQKLYIEYERQQMPKGIIYENVAKIYQKMCKMEEYVKYINLSYEQYKKNGNTRKMSELGKAIMMKIRK